MDKIWGIEGRQYLVCGRTREALSCACISVRTPWNHKIRSVENHQREQLPCPHRSYACWTTHIPDYPDRGSQPALGCGCSREGRIAEWSILYARREAGEWQRRQ